MSEVKLILASIIQGSATIPTRVLHGSRSGKILRDYRQWETMFSECSKFHPNRFTSGGVIAEHVNTVKTHHKVFSIFGLNLASSRIMKSFLTKFHMAVTFDSVHHRSLPIL